jgi:hypothetical protein
MPFSLRITVVAACLWAAAYGCAQDNPGPLSKKDDKQSPVAKSHDELARLVSVALDKEDYEAVVQLMAPVSLLKETGASEKKQASYVEYLAGIPQLARQYRVWLRQKGLLPLEGKKFQKFEERDGPRN